MRRDRKRVAKPNSDQMLVRSLGAALSCGRAASSSCVHSGGATYCSGEVLELMARRFASGLESKVEFGGRCVNLSSVAPNKAAFTMLLSGS